MSKGVELKEKDVKANLMLSGKDPGEKMDVALAYCTRFPTLHTFQIIGLFAPAFHIAFQPWGLSG